MDKTLIINNITNIDNIYLISIIIIQIILIKILIEIVVELLIMPHSIIIIQLTQVSL
jgi:hypothetical protein